MIRAFRWDLRPKFVHRIIMLNFTFLCIKNPTNCKCNKFSFVFYMGSTLSTLPNSFSKKHYYPDDCGRATSISLNWKCKGLFSTIAILITFVLNIWVDLYLYFFYEHLGLKKVKFILNVFFSALLLIYSLLIINGNL